MPDQMDVVTYLPAGLTAVLVCMNHLHRHLPESESQRLGEDLAIFTQQ